MVKLAHDLAAVIAKLTLGDLLGHIRKCSTRATPRCTLPNTSYGQGVFNRHGSPPVPLVPLILDHNVRNTRQIANAFQPLVDHPMRFLGGEGPAVTFIACSRDEAMDVGDDQIEALIDEGNMTVGS